MHYANIQMNNHPGTMIVEYDLKKRRLEEEIMQLERELHRQDKKTVKEESSRKDHAKLSVSEREEKLSLRSSTPKESRPAISHHWKQLFTL